MFKSTYVSLEAMRDRVPNLPVIEGEDMFYADLTVFTSHEVRLGWPKKIMMSRPGVLASPIPVYYDLHDTALTDLGREYAGSFIELVPLHFVDRLNNCIKFRCDDDNELTHFLVKIHWPAPTPPTDSEQFQTLCLRLNAIASSRILPGDTSPCGLDYLIIPNYSLTYNSRVLDYISKQHSAELYAADRAWRKYTAEVPYFKERITKMIQSDANLDRVFCAADEYVYRRSWNHTPNLDLHCALWYDDKTLRGLADIASGDFRLLRDVFR